VRLGRKNRTERPPGELAVTDFAAAGEADAPRLADREGWEVVVQQEVFLVGAFERVDELLVVARAEGRDHEGLRLAAGEESGTVRARKHAHFRDDGADRFEVASVDAGLGVEDRVADD